MDYVKYFEPLEHAREKGDYERALLLSQKALLEAGETRDQVLALNAWAHQLLVFKDYFSKTKNDFYLHVMHGVVAAGLTFITDQKIIGQPAAVFYLRAGDFYFQNTQYKEAVEWMDKALLELGKIAADKPGEYSEYLSHLGKAKVFAGKVKEGLEDLRAALQLTEGKTELREFHHLTVHSGNILRLAGSLHRNGDNAEAKTLLLQAQPLAERLDKEFHMPIRLGQVTEALARLG